jgi:hypothetical protein
LPRYFFHLHNDQYTEDEEGRECPNLECAREAAVAEARTMAASSVAEGHLDLSHFVRVTDARGRQVLTVTFGDAVAVRP